MTTAPVKKALYVCPECGHKQTIVQLRMADNGFDYTYSCVKCGELLESNGQTYCEITTI